MAFSIARAVVIKHGNVFFLAPEEGEIPFTSGHGFGLYYHDCRYLNGYELLVGDVHPEPLGARASEGARAMFRLTTPDFRMADGRAVPRETVGLKWERVIDSEQCLLQERLEIQNFGHEPVEFPLAMRFRAGFEDVFEIRGLLREVKGKLYRPGWRDKCLCFSYEGGDHVTRSLAVHFDPLPPDVKGSAVQFHLRLQPNEINVIRIVLAIAESDRVPATVCAQVNIRRDLPTVVRVMRSECEEWMMRETEVHTDSEAVNRIMKRSLMDLVMLRTTIGGDEFFAAGVPWYATLFGRDSLVTSLQTLAYGAETAADSLRLLARYQGDRVSEWRDEEPGKILHELRVGELARMNKIPHTPYYGTIDATPLFIILMSRYADWTGDLSLFTELRPHVERALEWIDRYGDAAGDGYVSYLGHSDKGLLHQGWKDSGDAIVTADGRFAEPPIALVEVQGYVYLAKRSIADLYERVGEPDRAALLREEARELRRRFNRDFWMEDEGCYALALETGGRPCRVLSSNAGQALWTGIVDEEKAGRVVDRLMRPDLFSGWGVRTLSYKERRYNPMGYHLGTVWPHDNSLIAAGFRRYGFDEAAGRIFAGLVDAAREFEDFRLPELFTGFGREEYGVPVRYPVACHPQAWAAGSVPFMIETLLGLEPEALEHRLRVVRPFLPDFIGRLDLRHLQVGKGAADLRFSRKADGRVDVEVLNIAGTLTVEVEKQ
ncbi:glycogen debranching N-terminal domain-containing protein [Nitrospira moscoviensis]|uniref:Putative Amylo-alpha-1,6-glucosidase n=1 Tax=Nitrospira moscoviensis TaxID=42253 RepID=A0A0K2GDP7_NITMO|nr:glycogen debranching N-terminal domain-containing protein [Nitrospira moscoviensis]ALA59081.1 putative Amylo-alpha-1,6-glucosidase [Nitrospira moscoviensis]